MKTLISCLAISLVFIHSSHADDAAVAAKFTKIPKPAAEALKKAAGSAHIETVNIEKDGKTTVYEVELTETGKPNREISVTADGQLHAEEVTIALDQAPAAVKAAIEAGAKGATIKRLQHITRGDKVTFEVTYDKKGKETEVEFLQDGTKKPE